MSSYIDRRGNFHKLTPDSVKKTRRGIFAACIANNHILLTWPPHSPKTPEIPGGGIEEGEDKAKAIFREIHEEADVIYQPVSPVKKHQETVLYYADMDNEFWTYDLTFWRLEGPSIDNGFFEGVKNPSDALASKWIPLELLDTLPLHAVHKLALKEILI